MLSRYLSQSSAIVSASLVLAIGGSAADAAIFSSIGVNPHQITEVGQLS